MAQYPLTQNGFKFRPTLILGLGGTGHRIALNVKAILHLMWGTEAVEKWVKIIVIDTSHEELSVTVNGRPLTLEIGHEFIDIGQTPVDRIKRNIDRQPAIKERMGGLISSLPPVVLRHGARQLRPLGLVALLWRQPDVERAIREAIWSLAGREHNDEQDGINVFIANSLVGGTGSSSFIDVAYMTRQLFDELGSLSDFCYITGIGVLPRAFHGINGPNLVTNTVASLKELNHCMMQGGFRARYPNGKTITTEQPPFNIYYLIDGVDERGHTWRGQQEVCKLAAEAICLQMGSQIGQKNENDFDNLDDVLSQRTADGHGTFYGSFGLAALVFFGRDVARLCAMRQARHVIKAGLLATAENAANLAQTRADQFLDGLDCNPGRLAELLARDDEGLPLTVDLTVPGWVARMSSATVPQELTRHVRDYEQNRLGADFKRWLKQNQEQWLEQAALNLTTLLTDLSRQHGLVVTRLFLEHVSERLARLSAQLTTLKAERDGQQTAQAQDLEHLELAFLQAGEAGFWWRGRRVAQAQHSYLTAAQALFEVSWQTQVSAVVLAALGRLHQLIHQHLSQCQAADARLQAVHRTLTEQGKTSANGSKLAGVTTRSLATPALVDQLYQRHAPPVADTLAGLFNDGRSPLAWHDTPLEAIETVLMDACRPPFMPLEQTNVEDVIAMQAENGSPEAFRTWLTTQATPSWNLDRSRLADGGTAMQQLEVLGVPDESDSIYRQHARMLVSTGDRERITAFVARIGAPHIAIQQWDSYVAAYEQARGHVPLHILPHFQADDDRARQGFALGSIFGFICNQGSYFYYHSADPLDPPHKLAQGLENSLQAFTDQQDLVQKVRDRVEQQVATQGIEATLHKLTRYYETSSSNGRPNDDELVLEMKRLVRAYADELRQIYQFDPNYGRHTADGEVDDVN